MSFDLKPYLDAVTAAQDALTEVAGRIDALFTDGKPEEALALQPELDNAEEAVQKAEKLYNAMARVSNRSEVARKFVPVSEPDHLLDEEEKPDEKVMKRKEFLALAPKAQSEFVLSGGNVVDDDEN